MTHEERAKTFPPGSRWWWAERQGGEVVHLSLVEAMWHVSWASDVFVRSVRSGKRYGVGENDLLPLSAFADPSDTHGRPRGKARAS